MVVQPGSYGAWSETPKTCFLTMRLISQMSQYSIICYCLNFPHFFILNESNLIDKVHKTLAFKALVFFFNVNHLKICYRLPTFIRQINGILIFKSHLCLKFKVCSCKCFDGQYTFIMLSLNLIVSPITLYNEICLKKSLKNSQNEGLKDRW